jgi:hypothetical protein
MDSDAEREERDEAHSRQGMLLATIGGKLGDQALVLQMHDGSLRALKEQLEQRADATEVVRLREELASMKKRMDEMEAAVARKVSCFVCVVPARWDDVSKVRRLSCRPPTPVVAGAME